MAEDDESILKNLSGFQSLRSFLRSEMSVDDGGGLKVTARITVRNAAPTSPDYGDIVFLGVGLRIIKVNDKGAYWPRIEVWEESDLHKVRQRYNEGEWYGGKGDGRSATHRFPDVTSDERSHGVVLFPGESVIFVVKTVRTYLPHLDIRVEGSVSRRHLFHISQPMDALKAWTQPP